MATSRQRASAQIGRLDDGRIGGIALQRLDAFLPQRRHRLLVVLDDEQRNALLAQGRADEAADPAMADQDDMVLETSRPDRLAHRRCFLRRFDRRGVRERLLAPGRIDVERSEQQRIDQNTDDGAGENQVAPILRQKAEREAAVGENERELPDLRQRGRDHQRG